MYKNLYVNGNIGCDPLLLIASDILELSDELEPFTKHVSTRCRYLRESKFYREWKSIDDQIHLYVCKGTRTAG